MMHKTIFPFVAFLAALVSAQEFTTSIVKASPAFVDILSAVNTASAHVNEKRQAAGSGTISDVTPHVYFSSSVGVLGCKINTNRVAYWREEVDCDNICVKLTNTIASRSVTLLRIDHSGGAHNISYDVWNYLATGNPAAPGTTITGDAMGDLHYEYLPADNASP